MREKVALGRFDQDQRGELTLLAVSGSHAHGLAHAGSDLDLRGVFVAPSADFFGLTDVREQVEIHHPDITIFELRKFCRLAAVGNPNILEMLFTPQESIVVASETWAQIVGIRDSFLSRVAYDAYIGYAKAQWHEASRLAAGGEAVHRWKERTRLKHLRHVFRVLNEGEQLFLTGSLKVRVQDVVGLRALVERPMEELAKVIEERIKGLEAISCPFPDGADWQLIDKVVVSVREEMLKKERAVGEQHWNLAEVDYEGRGWARPVASNEDLEVTV
jgi:predicted nucleotidyltransferase